MDIPFSFLTPWLERGARLPPFLRLGEEEANSEMGGFLTLQRAVPLHDSLRLAAESLQSSWSLVDHYFTQAKQLIGRDNPVLLTDSESELIRDALGAPPVNCLPVYLVSVGTGLDERVVYIGKTSSNSGRFKSGHAAFTKLHHPDFGGLRKTLYLAGVVLLSDTKDYLPLEWVRPLDRATSLLSSLEAQLIFEFKPDLNSHHTNRLNAQWQTSLHIQNVAGEEEFLNDYFCWPSEMRSNNSFEPKPLRGSA